jgi:hypothetical protein
VWPDHAAEVASVAEVNMDRQQVITVLESLANGIDPGTGARIPLDVFHTADTVRALFTASALLRSGSTKLTSAGAAWTAEEDARACSEFDAGMTVAQIALQHGRSSGAITARLVKLGRIDPATVKLRDRGARAAS